MYTINFDNFLKLAENNKRQYCSLGNRVGPIVRYGHEISKKKKVEMMQRKS